MHDGVLWTNWSLREGARRLLALGPPARRRPMRRVLSKLKGGRRTARQTKTMGPHPARTGPCDNMARRRRAYEASGDAGISIETKKTEVRRNVHRAGTTCTAETVETVDHDFGSASPGQLMPHGLSDMGPQQAHIHLNTSPDTSALGGESVALWGEPAGRTAHPRAKRLRVRGDGGGSDSATQYLCTEDLPGVAHRLGLERRVAHAPPYCAKHHPIAHRVLPHVTRACQGVICHPVDVAPHCIERTKTTTGLGVTVRMLDKV